MGAGYVRGTNERKGITSRGSVVKRREFRRWEQGTLERNANERKWFFGKGAMFKEKELLNRRACEIVYVMI